MIACRALTAMLLVVAACGPRGPMDVGDRAEYTDEDATLNSSYGGADPKIEMERRGDRFYVTVFQGRQESTGFSVRVERAIHVGTILRLRARFTIPESSRPVQAVTTSPAHTISFPFGADAIELYDQDDRGRTQWVRP